MDNKISVPTKAVLNLDKKFNLISVQEEIAEIELTPELGKLLLKMLGTTPEEALNQCINDNF